MADKGHEEVALSPLIDNQKRRLRKNEEKATPTSFFSLFRLRSRQETLLTVGGSLLCIVAGPFLPIILVGYGEFVNMIIDRQHPPTNGSSTPLHVLPLFGGGTVLENATWEVRMDALMEDAWAHSYIYIVTNVPLFLCLAVGVAFTKLSAARQAQKLRKGVFESILRHDMTWFDIHGGRSVTSKINEEVANLEEGIGCSLGIFCHFMGNIFFGFSICVSLSWKLSFVVGAILPLSIIMCIIVPKIQNSLAAKETTHAEKAGMVVSEALTNIRTVMAFEGEKKEVGKYAFELKNSSKYAIRRAFSVGLATGLTWALNLLSISLSFAYGARSLSADQPIYDIIAILGLMWMCAMRFSFAFRLLDNFISAKASGASIFATIDAPHGIDPVAESGMALNEVSGKIVFEDVSFSYPSRPEMCVLNKISITIKAGECVAIVGPSGSGKTTILQLLQRFYDVSEGDITIDGTSIRNLKVKWLRKQIGIVGQEASLFSGTVRDNILYGSLIATEEEVTKAAKKANAHKFVTNLEKGYATTIGSKGGTLSGGEKQRIAIARALIREPKILLLDEPTSALDSNNVDSVQKALDEASSGRTTILVTHRLSNLQNVDRIYAMDAGRVIEEGTYDELLQTGGLFSKLLKIEQDMARPMNFQTGDTESKDPKIGDAKRMSLDVNHVPSTVLWATKEDSKSSEIRSDKSFLIQLFKWNRPELPILSFGFLMAIVTGIGFPLYLIIYGELVGSFEEMTLENIQESSDKNVIYLIVILGVQFITMCCTSLSFSIAGERITHRIRVETFTSILHQEIGWFDDVKNHVGALCVRLSDDAKAVRDVTGLGIAMLFQAIVNLIVGTALSFYYSWELTLVTLLTVPFLFGGPFFEGYLNYQKNTTENVLEEEASRIAVEAVENKQVITSFGLEDYFMKKYSEALDKTSKTWKRSAVVRGLSIGFSNIVPNLGYTVSLAYGCYLIQRDNIPYKDVIKVGELVVLGGTFLAVEFVFSPILPAARTAISRLRSLLAVNSSTTGGKVKVLPNDFKEPKIQYSKVSMVYPTRPDTLVLNGVDFKITEGQHIGVIGPSGSGKSTILLLLQRLYEPHSGNITLNSTDIQSLTISALRSHLALVSQEPVLFSGTIRENISYGDNSKDVPLCDVIDAAKKANIHSFINSLPSGYETMLGANTQLSGGQKQRIAIARALVRNPKVLLLDEATSALDPENEAIVQLALNKATESRTTITVAHRHSAVAHTDVILTLEGGRLIEIKTRSNDLKS